MAKKKASRKSAPKSPTAKAGPVFSMSLSQPKLAAYVTQQMKHLFPDGPVDKKALNAALGTALERLENCFAHNHMKCYWDAKGPRFNHRHTDQYAVFLYFLSNAASRRDAIPLAEKAYALNKVLHGLDAFYEVALPDIFAVQHPVGTVLGRATYGNYFCAYQNVTVGSNLDGDAPTFGEGVVMYGGSRVIGKTAVGNNCLISASASIMGGTIPSNHVAFGQHPDVAVKPTRHNVKREIFEAGP